MSRPFLFLMGHPVSHSFSPAMQNAALRALNLPWDFVPIDLLSEEIPQALERFRASGVLGGNVTVPHKEKISPWIDRVEGAARDLGSVNTVYRKGGRWIGTSTDGEGFLRSLGPWRKKLKGSRGLLIGAGGSALAVGHAMALSGVREIWVGNRTLKNSERMIRVLRERFRGLSLVALPLAESERALRSRDWVIQTTSLGLDTGDPSPIRLARARPGTWVVDLLYHRETAFLRLAKRQGLPALGGLGMLLHQGALSLELWTGRKAPLEVMKRALLDRLSQSRVR
ncbi:MAG TPA: shikimate dehydrogenase [bacterium]|nr:shikimate dehydrogenase [bacterium]